jgi:phosphopentomutase
MDITLGYLRRPGPQLVFTNLVDFDSKYGHRNDPVGYARCVEGFDRRLGDLREAVCGDGDGVLFVTGDHGCDPTTIPSTDHTREYTPLLMAGAQSSRAVDLGIRSPFGDLGVTVCDLFGVDSGGLAGTSFAKELRS